MMRDRLSGQPDDARGKAGDRGAASGIARPALAVSVGVIETVCELRLQFSTALRALARRLSHAPCARERMFFLFSVAVDCAPSGWFGVAIAAGFRRSCRDLRHGA